eukprot:2665191-Rhodomonas_salina.2
MTSTRASSSIRCDCCKSSSVVAVAASIADGGSQTLMCSVKRPCSVSVTIVWQPIPCHIPTSESVSENSVTVRFLSHGLSRLQSNPNPSSNCDEGSRHGRGKTRSE